MKPLSNCSGGWVGIWSQFGTRGHMRLNMKFSGGSIEGHGCDLDGPFVIVGSYESSFSVELTKGYSSGIFCYQGKWDGAMISGTSHELGDPSNHGDFEMWPEGEDTNVEALEALREDELSHA
jgi:hypothetical protein